MRLIDADALMRCIPAEEIASRMAVANAPTVVEFDGEITKVIVWGEEYVNPERSLRFRIGEICVDESKKFISSGRAVEKIRELLRAERREE